MRKNRVYELAKRLLELKATEQSILNSLDKVRRQIVETESEIYEAIKEDAN